MTQATLADFDVTNTPDAGGPVREWGPTMRRPVPEAEEMYLPGSSVDKRALAGTGLAPGDFEILNGKTGPDLARERGYHPDDEHRPERRKRELDNTGFLAALAEQGERHA